MEFTCTTVYDHKALTAMNRAMRKTVRKKQSLRSRISAIIVMFLALVMSFSGIAEGEFFSLRTVVNGMAFLLILIVLIWEDSLNARLSRRRLMAGVTKTTAVFTEEGITSQSEVGKSEWNYSLPLAIAETEEFFVFAIDTHYGQVYAKSGLSGGTPEQFAAFLTERTGLPVQKV
ncbi:MAG: YcxB family protein [Clostridia bacterium]|nr:YcxB family protein [Clostridia bacterium]